MHQGALHQMIASHVALASMALASMAYTPVFPVSAEVTAAQLGAQRASFVHSGMSPMHQEALHQMIVLHAPLASMAHCPSRTLAPLVSPVLGELTAAQMVGLCVRCVLVEVTAAQMEALSVCVVHPGMSPPVHWEEPLHQTIVSHVTLACMPPFCPPLPSVISVLRVGTAAQLEACSVSLVHRGTSHVKQEALHQMIVLPVHLASMEGLSPPPNTLPLVLPVLREITAAPLEVLSVSLVHLGMSPMHQEALH